MVYMLFYVGFVAVLIFFMEFALKGLVLVPILVITLVLILLIVFNPYRTQHAQPVRYILAIVQQVTLTVPLYLLWISGFL